MGVARGSGFTLRRNVKGLVNQLSLPNTLLWQLVGITWIYCPGHVGVLGNEKADGLYRRQW
jgi:hypothetical protein